MRDFDRVPPPDPPPDDIDPGGWVKGGWGDQEPEPSEDPSESGEVSTGD
jgi:hypothetical protein